MDAFVTNMVVLEAVTEWDENDIEAPAGGKRRSKDTIPAIANRWGKRECGNAKVTKEVRAIPFSVLSYRSTESWSNQPLDPEDAWRADDI